MGALGWPRLSNTEWWLKTFLISYGMDREDIYNSKAPSFSSDPQQLPERGDIDAGRQEIVKLLFAAHSKATPDFATSSGLLSAAAGSGNAGIVTYLLEHGAAVNDAPGNTLPPLLAAAVNGQVAVVDLLLKAGAELLAVEKNTKKNALHLAAEKGQVAMVKRLLDAGMPIDSPDGYRKQPALWWALTGKQMPAALALIERGANVNTGWGDTVGEESSAVYALRNGTAALWDKMLAAGMNVSARNRFGMALLHYAAAEDNLPAVQWLLAHGANVNDETNYEFTPLFGAKTTAMADLLLAKGATLTNAKKTRAVVQSADTLAMLQWCAAHGANLDEVNADGVTPLFKFAGIVYLQRPKTDVTDMMAYLLKQGANPNAHTISGMTPLANAAERGLTEAVALLLENGADPNIADNQGLTPLQRAFAGDAGLAKAKLLLAKGAKPDVVNAKGESALYTAVQKGNIELVALLLGQGANQVLAAKDGDIPLLLAMRAGNAKIVDVLVAAKPNLKGVTGRDGASPVTGALHNPDLLDKLLALGAAVNGTYTDSHRQKTTLLHTASELWDGTVIVEAAQSSGASVPWATADAPTMVQTTKPDPAKAIGKRVVETLVNHGADLNAVNVYGESPLYIAIRFRNQASATVLIDKGADLQVKSKYADTPTLMHAAVYSNCVELVKLLHQKGLHLDNSAFFSARHGEVMDYLVAQGLSPNTKNDRGGTPLHNAVWAMSATTMEQLLIHGADPAALDGRGRTVVEYMQEMQGDGSLIRDYARKYQLMYVALGKYTLKSADGWTLLHAAAESNQRYVIDKLLANGVDINVPAGDFGITPLIAAINARNLDGAAYLLGKKGCNVNAHVKTGQTALHAAIAVVRPPGSKPGPIIDPMANERNNPEAIGKLVTLLLDHGADAALADDAGKLPVDYLNTRKVEFWPLAFLLANAGKKTGYKTPGGLTLLHMAVGLGDAANVKQLIVAKADLTPLHIATICRQYALLKTLVDAGCNVTVADTAGMTALHLLVDLSVRSEALPTAAVWGLSEPDTLAAIDNLLAHGADINARNKAGQSAFDLVTRSGANKALRDALLAKGAK
jgi:ankyrin repeat protein